MELTYKSYVGGNSSDYYYDYYLLYFIWAGKNELFRLTSSTCSGQYRYSVSAGPALTTDSAGFFRVLTFLCLRVCLCVSHNLCVCGSICNLFQVFKTLMSWCSQWPLSQKVIKTQWLTLGDWGCPLDNDPKLVSVQQNSR